MKHRVPPWRSKVLTISLVLCFSWTHLVQVLADVKVGLELAEQLPPLAHKDYSYNWQFSPETFTVDSDAPLSYSIEGLPAWAHFHASELRITGQASKKGKQDEINNVKVIAEDGNSQATSSFQLVTISAPPPKLNISVQDQLPKAASMGEGNMLADKVLHMPLGWSFSIGFLGGTFVLPENDRVYYSSRLVGGRPLPSWLNFNPDDITYSGIAPTSAGKRGTSYDIELIGSNRPNTGGPSSAFTLLLGEGFVTLNNSAAALPVGNVTEGDTLEYHISQDLFLLDGFSQSPNEFTFKLDSDAPDWIHYDAASQNLTGKVPFDGNNTQLHHDTFKLHVSHPNAFDTVMNVTLDIFPSPFKRPTLPNVTVQTGKDFRVSLEDYLRDANVNMNVTFDSMMRRRSMRYRDSRPTHRWVRRNAPSWVHYDDETHSLVGQAPDSEQKVAVHMSADNPVPNSPIPPASQSFQLLVHNSTRVNHTEPIHPHSGLTSGEKGAIAGSILGATLLALVAFASWWAWKRGKNGSDAMDPSVDATSESLKEGIASGPSSIRNANYTNPGPGTSSDLADTSEIRDSLHPSSPASTAGAAAAGGTATATATAAAASGKNKATDKSTGDLPLGTQSATRVSPTDEPYMTPPGSAGNSTRSDRNYEQQHPRQHEFFAGVTQDLPYNEPEWQRDDDQIIITPFLAQSSWQPPLFTQMWGSKPYETGFTAYTKGPDRAESRTKTTASSSEVPESSHTGKSPKNFNNRDHVSDDTSLPAGVSDRRRRSARVPAQITYRPSSPEPDTTGSDKNDLTTKNHMGFMAENTNSLSELPNEIKSSESNLPQRASFLADFEPRGQKDGLKPSHPEEEPSLSQKNTPRHIPTSISKQSQESWEENLWYEMPPAPKRMSQMQQHRISSPVTLPSATALDTQPSRSKPVADKPPRLETPLRNRLSPIQMDLASASTRSQAATTIKPVETSSRHTSSNLSPPIDQSSFEGVPQLAPIASSVVRSPIMPDLDDPPQVVLPLENNKGSPLDAFVAPTTQPMDIEKTRHVASYTPKLESGPLDRRSQSLNAEQLDSAGVFDDADEYVLDPFADEQYADGTVLYQEQQAASNDDHTTDVTSSGHLNDYLTTEGGIYSIIEHDDGSDQSQPDARNNATAAPTQPPRSGTMASIQMAQTRSVTFTPAKPPRLQLASCRPGQFIALPLMTSDASVPQNLAEAIQKASSPARYIPQLFAPSRPDLHGTWPEWLAWLAWNDDAQELAGTVPEQWPEKQRLPIQLPIHIQLSNGRQILQESGVPRHELPESSVPLLAARILLTILPAASPSST